MFRIRTRTLAIAFFATGLAAVPAKAQEFINVLTGGTSEVHYPLGAALAEIYGKGIEGSPARRCKRQRPRSRTSTCCSRARGRDKPSRWAISAGSAGEGNTVGRLSRQAGQTARHRRHLSELHPDRRQPGIRHQVAGRPEGQEPVGRRAGVGKPTLNARAIFAAAGITYEDLGKVEYPPFAESVELIKNRQLDATLQSAGLGVASIRDLATSVPINVVAVPAEDVTAKIGSPYLSVKIPAGT